MKAINMQAVRTRVGRLADACRPEGGPPSMTFEELVAGSWGTSDGSTAADDSKWVALMAAR